MIRRIVYFLSINLVSVWPHLIARWRRACLDIVKVEKEQRELGSNAEVCGWRLGLGEYGCGNAATYTRLVSYIQY